MILSKFFFIEKFNKIAILLDAVLFYVFGHNCTINAILICCIPTLFREILRTAFNPEAQLLPNKLTPSQNNKARYSTIVNTDLRRGRKKHWVVKKIIH